MRAQADKIGELVEHLVLDDCRFEIGDKHSLAPALGRLDEHIDRGIADRLPGECFGVDRIAVPEDKIASPAGRQPVRLTVR